MTILSDERSFTSEPRCANNSAEEDVPTMQTKGKTRRINQPTKKKNEAAAHSSGTSSSNGALGQRGPRFWSRGLHDSAERVHLEGLWQESIHAGIAAPPDLCCAAGSRTAGRGGGVERNVRSSSALSVAHTAHFPPAASASSGASTHAPPPHCTKPRGQGSACLGPLH